MADQPFASRCCAPSTERLWWFVRKVCGSSTQWTYLRKARNCLPCMHIRN